MFGRGASGFFSFIRVYPCSSVVELSRHAYPMSLSGSRSRLSAISKELAIRWRETKNYWRDSKSQEFEQRYMDELLARVDKTVTVIEKLDKLIEQVRRDCE